MSSRRICEADVHTALLVSSAPRGKRIYISKFQYKKKNKRGVFQKGFRGPAGNTGREVYCELKCEFSVMLRQKSVVLAATSYNPTLEQVHAYSINSILSDSISFFSSYRTLLASFPPF